MSISAGVGSAISFRCSECAKALSWRNANRGRNWELTGRQRKARKRQHHARGLRHGELAYQYHCRDCDHVGWTTHSEAAQLFDREFGAKKNPHEHEAREGD